MGDIPAKTSMVSSIILNPQTGSQIPSDTTFNITVQMSNLVAGSFTNADATYYAAPQTLQNGQVVGHTHVTVQDLGQSLNPTQALDATQFAFFKGINDAGNGQGLLSAEVAGGLPAGNYRVCTMASASNHQPVLMPVAQRGTADDCTKFVVTGNGNTINVAASDGSSGIAAAVSFPFINRRVMVLTEIPRPLQLLPLRRVQMLLKAQPPRQPPQHQPPRHLPLPLVMQEMPLVTQEMPLVTQEIPLVTQGIPLRQQAAPLLRLQVAPLLREEARVGEGNSRELAARSSPRSAFDGLEVGNRAIGRTQS
jgi:hypothetical protein